MQNLQRPRRRPDRGRRPRRRCARQGLRRCPIHLPSRRHVPVLGTATEGLLRRQRRRRAQHRRSGPPRSDANGSSTRAPSASWDSTEPPTAKRPTRPVTRMSPISSVCTRGRSTSPNTRCCGRPLKERRSRWSCPRSPSARGTSGRRPPASWYWTSSTERFRRSSTRHSTSSMWTTWPRTSSGARAWRDRTQLHRRWGEHGHGSLPGRPCSSAPASRRHASRSRGRSPWELEHSPSSSRDGF